MEKYLYEKIEKDIEAKIVKGFYKNNELPTEEKLRKEYDVSRVTLRQALNILKQKSLIYKIRGKGTFIRDENKEILTKTISVIMYNVGSPIVSTYTTLMLKGLYDANAKLGYNFKIFNYKSEEPSAFAAKMIESGTKVALVLSNVPAKILEELKASGIIFVIVNLEIAGTNYNSVFVDKELTGELAAEYLVKAGCKNIGMLTSNLKKEFQEVTMAEGFLCGVHTILKKHGLKEESLTVKAGAWGRSTLEKELEELFAKHIDGLICTNEINLRFTLEYFQRAGKEIENIKLVGCCPNESIYPVTTVGIPQTKAAEMALNLLHLLISNPKLSGQKIILEPALRATDKVFI